MLNSKKVSVGANLGCLCLFLYMMSPYPLSYAVTEECVTGGAIADGSGSATPGTPLVTTLTYPASETDPIIDFNFRLEINHTYIGDLIVTLESPAGTVVTLLNRPGRDDVTGTPTFGCSRDNINVILDDEATADAETTCPTSDPTLSGSLRPTGNLSDFDGEPLAGTWTLTVTDNARFDTGSVLATTCVDSSTSTPVSLNSFKSKQHGDSLLTQWQTNSETFNVGFHIWAQLNNSDWVQLNKKLLPTQQGNSFSQQDYQAKFNLRNFSTEIQQLGISSLSSTGEEDFFGPFEIGESYGEEHIPDTINWEQQRAKYTASMLEAGYVYFKGKYRKPKEKVLANIAKNKQWINKLQQRFPSVYVSSDKIGIHRVTHQDLVDQGVNWLGAPLRKIAVSTNGKAISRLIRGKNKSRFGKDSEIIFAVTKPSGDLSRYIKKQVYELSLSEDFISHANYIDNVDMNAEPIDSYPEQIKLGKNNFYNYSMHGPKPWYDTQIVANQTTAAHIIDFQIENDLISQESVEINVDLVGAIDFVNQDADGDGEVEDDHHVKLYLNRTKYPDPIWEGSYNGIGDWPIYAAVPGSHLVADQTNYLEIEVVPNNAQKIDVVLFNEASIHYHRPAHLSNTLVQFNPQMPSTDTIGLYQFTRSKSVKDIEVFVYDQQGHLALIKHNSTASHILFNNLPHSDGTYVVLSGSEIHTPNDIYIKPIIDPSSLNLDDTELVIISDPAFINNKLTDFVTFQQNTLKRNTKIINRDDIYTNYGFGMPNPVAIQRYLKEQQHSNYQAVLLVGGHNFNYLGYGQAGSNSAFTSIPSFYRSTNRIIAQTPTAVPFVDFDNNGIPDKAIGRWPVRNSEELSHIIDKTILWHQQGSVAESQSALLIAGVSNEQRFKKTLEKLSMQLGADTNKWSNLSHVYMDDLIADPTLNANQISTVAHTQIKDALRAGKTITLFAGHGSVNRWSFQNVMTPDLAKALDNNDTPSLAVPLACYTSYYESPTTNTLAHSLLFSKNKGMAGISSAAVTSKEAHNERFAEELLVAMTQYNMSLGKAVLFVKQKLGNSSSDYQDIVYNWTTLADPTLSFHQIPIEPNEEISTSVEGNSNSKK